jgi:outer membrane immunogenic protein
MRRAIGAFAALAISASAACAKQPPVPFSWTGLYVGAGIGGGAAIHEPSIHFFGGSPVSFDSSAAQGFLVTAVAGYDYRVNRTVVAGVFFDYDLSDISTNADLPLLFSSGDHRHSWALGARAGYLVSPATLLYLAAGYTRAGFDFGTLGGVDHIGGVDLQGYFLGVGVEAQLAGNWSLRGEYRFTQFDPNTVFHDPCGCGSLDIETSMHTGRALLIYRFNSGGPLAPP